MEFLLMAVFSAALLVCMFTGVPVIVALIFGYFIFLGYGLKKNIRFKEMFSHSMEGVKTVKNIMITMAVIGILTAVWRSCGSIAYIVYYASAYFSPSIMVLASFLLCSLLSFLIGTSFGTAATLGVICTTMAGSMGIPVLFTGGAVLAGAFFGDRCSPVSTSALLVSELTNTNLYDNIKNMIKSAFVPFIISSIIYLLMGIGTKNADVTNTARVVFKSNYNMSPWMLIPIIVVIILAFFRVKVIKILMASAISGIFVDILVQKSPIITIPKLCILGFHSTDNELSSLMNGGGLISMVSVILIVCISSSYSGMFKATGFLNSIEEKISTLSRKTTPFTATFMTATVTSVVTCNQTLSIMLTDQICKKEYEDNKVFSIDISNTAVVISALIPWSIAASVPLATINAPSSCVITAVYLYLLPIWELILSVIKKKRLNKYAEDSSY